MGLMDKVKAQAAQVAQKAQDAGRAGQAKLDQSQKKRREDSLLRDLGAAVYAERTGRADPEREGEIDGLIAALRAYEAEHGAVSTAATADDDAADGATESAQGASYTGSAQGAPEGDFKLD